MSRAAGKKDEEEKNASYSTGIRKERQFEITFYYKTESFFQA